MHPVQEGDVRVKGSPGGADVGGYHKLLNKLLGFSLGAGQDVYAYAFPVQHKLCLVAGQIHFPAPLCPGLEHMGQLPGAGKAVLHRGIFL